MRGENIKRNILVISSMIPPDYTGAGKRAYRHCRYLHEQNILAGLITQTGTYMKESNSQTKLPEKYIYRIPVIWKKDRYHKNAFQKLLEDIYCTIKTFSYLVRNRKQIGIIHSFSGGNIGVVVFSKLFRRPLITEFTLLPDTKRKTAHWSQEFSRNIIYNSSDVIVCISDALEKWCRENKIRTKTIIIYNETTFSPPSESKDALRNRILAEDLKGRSPVILFMGPRTYRKGFDIVYEVHEIMRKEYPDHLLIILGLFDTKIPINGKRYDITHYLEKRDIVHLGDVPDPEVYYQIADVTLFPSRREGFPNVVIESMASGTPVVARKLKGITDIIIDDGVDGYLVDGDDPEAYFNKIKMLMNDGNKYYSMAKAGVDKVNHKFNTDTILSQYLSLYKDYINK